MTPDCTWLVQLADAKINDMLPQLASVKLKERTFRKWKPHGPELMSTDWNAPDMVNKAFKDAGIHFSAKVRAFDPDPFRNDPWAYFPPEESA